MDVISYYVISFSPRCMCDDVDVLFFWVEKPTYIGSMSYSPSSSSNSASSSAVASWYCWYSDTKSFMLDSASVNSISSIPSPVYQWRKAFRLNIAVNCSLTRLNSSWMAVELPMKVEAILRPRGGMSHTAVLTLLGIHSTKNGEFLFWMLYIWSSTSLMDMRPRKIEQLSGSVSGEDHKQPSCSWHQTSAH